MQDTKSKERGYKEHAKVTTRSLHFSIPAIPPRTCRVVGVQTSCNAQRALLPELRLSSQRYVSKMPIPSDG